jgi:hypothetical protein
MDLGFKTQFKDKILNGTKIHTIREDKHERWKEGKKIHFITGMRTKKRDVFLEGTCTNVDDIWISGKSKIVIINGVKRLKEDEIETLAKNDGFGNVEGFWDWFGDKKGEDYRLIHWTDRHTDNIYLPF